MVVDLKSKFKEIMSFAFLSWVKDKVLLKYLLFLFVFGLIINYAITYFAYYTLAPFAANPNIAPGEIIGLILYLGTFVLIMIITSILVSSVVGYFIFLRVLDSRNKKQNEFSWSKWLWFFILGIVEAFAALFSIYNLVYLLIPIAGIVLLIGGIIFVVLASTNYLFALFAFLCLLISALLFLAYLVIVIYNSVRLSLARPIFVEKQTGIMDSLKQSWGLAKGNVLVIFAIFFAIGLVLVVLNWVLSLPMGLLFGANAPFEPKNPAQAIAILVNPATVLLSIPQVFLQSYIEVVQILGLVAIYFVLSGQRLGRGLTLEQKEQEPKAIFYNAKSKTMKPIRRAGKKASNKKN